MNSENVIRIDSSKTHLKKPKYNIGITITKFKNLDIAVGVIDARKAKNQTGRTIIWPMQYGSRMDQFESQKLQIIANALNVRIIGVEVPGVGISHKAKSTLADKICMLFGSYRSPACSMLQAVKEVVEFTDNEQIEFMGYSQGAAVCASMVGVLSERDNGMNLKVTRLTLIDAVNDQNRNIFELHRQLVFERTFVDRYLADNNKYNWLKQTFGRDPKTKVEHDSLAKKQLRAKLICGLALRGGFASTLVNAVSNDLEYSTSGISQAQIDILKLSESSISSINNNRITANSLRSVMNSGRVSLLVILAPKNTAGYNHHAIDSMPFADALSRKVLID